MNQIKIGHIVAPFTPLNSNRSLNLSLIESYAEFLIRNHLDGVFLCGSSGEGALFNRDERIKITEKWMDAAGTRLKVIIHTGGTNLVDQRYLAAHAQGIGVYAISAMAPMFLGPKRTEELGAFCKSVCQAAPDLPFYYYHIPGLNGINLPVLDLLKYAMKRSQIFQG